ncbi:MAG: choice-of-anchor D domain-containing protein [Pseudobdellovibrio sp.]
MKFFMLILGFLVSTAAMASNSIEIKANAPGIEDYSSYDFGTVFVNTQSTVRFTVTNTGTTPLTFKDAYIMGSDFRAAHNCDKGLQPKERCEFDIQFWPMFEGITSGRFLLDFNEDQVRVDLWGRAQRM